MYIYIYIYIYEHTHAPAGGTSWPPAAGRTRAWRRRPRAFQDVMGLIVVFSPAGWTSPAALLGTRRFQSYC